jgi:two-component system LytT family sensor kinase
MKHVRRYIFLYFTAAMALDVLYRCLDRVVWHHPPQWGLSILEQATGYYLSMSLLPFVFWVTRRWPIAWSPARIGIHGIAVVVFAIMHTSLMWGSRLVLSPLLGLGSYDYGSMPMRYFMEFPRQVIGYAMWVAAFTVYNNWLRTKDLETQLVSARLENLSHQLQPHFLFNALNAVSATIYEDPSRADRMLERICDFLRATLRLPDSPMVPVSTELALARQYLDVMKARLEDRLHFEIRCDSNSESVPVPALLLQPLVENAVEHGQDPASGRLDIGIDVRRNGKSVYVTIRDHGVGFPAASKNGHGLSNAQRRLATVYGKNATLRCAGHPEGGAVVEVQIPV